MILRDDDRLHEILRKLKPQPAATLPELAQETERIINHQGIQAAYNLVQRAEVILGLRKPKLAIYDHALHVIGGAQKYGLTLASVLQDTFDITIIANKEISSKDFLNWYNLDLSGCRIKIISLPFFEEKHTFHLDPALVTKDGENPFQAISRESGNYDVFINNSMNEMVYPLAGVSILICYFPERRPETYFYVDSYDYIIHISRYTAEWIEKKWRLTPHQHIYPFVDIEAAPAEAPKKKIILSVARFEGEGTKRQKEMAEAFLRLNEVYPEIAADWKFILAGGSSPANPYLSRLADMMRANPRGNIELKVNISAAELKSLYRESTLFWHLCGLNHDDPSAIEHFGMTTIEAMHHSLVPIVYDGGGQREIVADGLDGFRVRSRAELLERTIELIRDKELTRKLAAAAQKKALEFSREKFEEGVRVFFDRILKEYRTF
jgi:glycosyltransferase involved in cell wall biosynthesis